MGVALDAAEKADVNQIDYYTILDLEYLGGREQGREFVEWVMKNTEPSELLFELAKDARVVLLLGCGFGTAHPSGPVGARVARQSQRERLHADRPLDPQADGSLCRALQQRNRQEGQ